MNRNVENFHYIKFPVETNKNIYFLLFSYSLLDIRIYGLRNYYRLHLLINKPVRSTKKKRRSDIDRNRQKENDNFLIRTQRDTLFLYRRNVSRSKCFLDKNSKGTNYRTEYIYIYTHIHFLAFDRIVDKNGTFPRSTTYNKAVRFV